MPFRKEISNNQYQISTNIKSRIRHLKLAIGNWKFKEGFTLIELLIVVAIMAMLSGAILYSTNNTREKGRDAKRKDELEAISSALTLYYTDHSEYPLLTNGELRILDYSSDNDNWLPGLGDYLQKQPKDPLKANLSNSIAGVLTRIAGQAANLNSTKGQVAGAYTDSWTVAFNSPETVIMSLTFDSIHKVLYAGGSLEGKIFRCDTVTNCDNDTDWNHISFNASPPSSAILSLTFDSVNGFIYAGLGDVGDIYRCDTSTSCSDSSNWTKSLDSPITDGVSSLTFDSANSVIYAGLAGDIWRCNIPISDCNESTDWSVTYDTNETTINSLAYDAVKKVIYAGANDDIYRCDISVYNCDEQTDWGTAYHNDNAGGIYALTFDTINRVIYAGASSSNIYRCIITTNCDESTEWTTSYSSTAGPILSLTFDTINGDLYAGTYGGGGIIFRCHVSSTCTSNGNWQTSYDSPDSSIYSLTFDSINGVVYAGSSKPPGQGHIFRSGPATDVPTPPTDTDNPGGDPGSTGGACDSKTEIYCYRVSWNKKHFVLWAQLENLNDPQIYNSTSGAATCTQTPPTGSLLNYCLKSPE